MCEQRRLWRDSTDAQARLSLRWSPMWYVPKSHELAQTRNFNHNSSNRPLYQWVLPFWKRFSVKSIIDYLEFNKTLPFCARHKTFYDIATHDSPVRHFYPEKIGISLLMGPMATIRRITLPNRRLYCGHGAKARCLPDNQVFWRTLPTLMQQNYFISILD